MPELLSPMSAPCGQCWFSGTLLFFSAFAERREGGAPKDQVLEEVDVRQKENPNSTRRELWEPSDVSERDMARSVTLWQEALPVVPDLLSHAAWS